MNLAKKISVVILYCIALCSCSFEPRSKIAFPDELHQICFTTDRPYSALSNQLNELFRSMNVQIVKQKKAAPFSIVISYDHFSYSRPDIVDSTLPTGINFSQSVTAAIINNKNGATVDTRSFTTVQTITLNANQIYTTNANEEVKQTLNRQMVSLIYYWLISLNTKAALHNAIVTQTTQHAS